MSDKKTASLPTHTRHQSVSGPYPVLAAHPAENHRWVRPRGQPVRPRGSLIKRAREPAVEASGQQNVYGAGNPGGRWWKPPGSTTTPEVVDWGRSGPNQMITLNALRVLKAADRLTLPATRT
jgi:hypothetical protein